MKHCILALILASILISCSDDEKQKRPSSPISSTSVFVATDRHETGSGNNLAKAVQMVSGNLNITTPDVILLGGDYVGSGPDEGETGQPPFTISDVRNEILRALPSSTDMLFTYGSHDRGCTDGYNVFFSGPRRCDGYYAYGISYAQMVYDTDSLTQSAYNKYLEQQENANDSLKAVLPDSASADSAIQPFAMRSYNGLDITDPFGISAQSASASFLAWTSTLTDHAPIIIMSHVPMHAFRNDNRGALMWFEAISHAAETHDIILFFGHNHTPEERGDTTEQAKYLLVPGDSIYVQNGNIGAEGRVLNFTYANAGYLKLGWATLVTLSDYDGNGRPDQMQLRRFSINGEDASFFGSTGKQNPHIITLRNE